MKSKRIYLGQPIAPLKDEDALIAGSLLGGGDYQLDFKIPTLPAYALSSLDVEIVVDFERRITSSNCAIDGQIISVFFSSRYRVVVTNAYGTLDIHYYGINDYQYFFPYIENIELRKRLALFLEEAYKSFETGAWFSFVIATGSVIEGLLYWYHGMKDKSFNSLIDGLYGIESFQPTLPQKLHMIREYRNLNHPSKYEKPYVSQENAMNVMSILDDMLLHDWETIKSN